MSVGSQVMLKHAAPNPTFYIGEQSIQHVNLVSDLGITIDSNLKFSQHINIIVRKALARSNLIFKCFQSKDTATLVRAFKTFVLPLLEYNSPVWSPHLLKDINLIEKVQRRFTKRLPGMSTLSYEDRLSTLSMERLEARRLRADLLTAYKIIFGLTIIDSATFFKFNECTINTRGHGYKLLQPGCCCDARRGCFTVRVVKLWNSLPPNCTDFSNIYNFKKSLNYSLFSNLCVGKH
jgi:hypothetical protein